MVSHNTPNTARITDFFNGSAKRLRMDISVINEQGPIHQELEIEFVRQIGEEPMSQGLEVQLSQEAEILIQVCKLNKYFNLIHLLICWQATLFLWKSKRNISCPHMKNSGR